MRPTEQTLFNKLYEELANEVPTAKRSNEALLRILVQSIIDYQESTNVLRKEGRTITAGTGSQKLHPLVAFQKQSADLVTRLSAELLLSPKSRAKVEAELEASELDNYHGE